MKKRATYDELEQKIKSLKDEVSKLKDSGKTQEDPGSDLKQKEMTSLFNLTIDMLCTADINGCFRSINKAFETILGFTKEELLSKPYTDFVHPDDVASTIEEGNKQSHGQKTIYFENRYRCKDGTYKWLAWTSIPDPETGITFAVARDITERKQIDKLLNIQKDLAIKLSNTTGLNEGTSFCLEAAIEVSDMDCGGVYLFDNETGALDMILHNNLPEYFLKTESHYGPDAPNIGLIMSGTPFYTNFKEISVSPETDKAAGQEMLLAIGILPIKHQDKVIGCMNVASRRLDEVPVFSRVALEAIAAQIGSSIDRLQEEDELKSYREHLEELVAERTKELETAHTELLRKEKFSALGKATAMVSHEIRNPLSVIRAAIYSLSQMFKGKAEDVDETLDRVIRNIARCDFIIEEMLDFTRIRNLNPGPININEWLERELDELIIPDSISLIQKLNSDIVISMDQERLHQCLVNIVNNAWQSMDEDNEQSDKKEKAKKKNLTVESGIAGDRLEIIVKDSGSGISPDEMKKIFEPLYSTKATGVGLGMPRVKQIMEQHGGGIEVESVKGKGTEVKLWLPVQT